MKFLNKNILFISPKFFNYEIEIFNFLKQNGANVIFYDERPSNNQIIKGLIRLKFIIGKIFINIYYIKIIQKIIFNNKNFDFFLLIKGESTPIWFIKKLKNIYPHTHFIYYSYDSLNNNAKSSTFFTFFDKKYSFECNKELVEKDFKFKPLFYLKEYEDISNYILNRDIDILFIATLHSDRFIVFDKLLKKINNYNLSVYNFLFISGKLNFFFNKIFNTSFKNINLIDVSFTPLKKNDIINLIARSNCIIDIEHPLQNGLTMRTIEAIGAKRKIITTNTNILEYDFYNPNNICVIDRQNPCIPLNFFEIPYLDIKPEIYYKYSLKCWITEIFSTK